MVSCFAPGCKSGYGKRKAHMFKPTKAAAEKWIKILWKLRSDLKFDPSVQCHKLCHLHFSEAEIIKQDIIIINGEKNTIPRCYWKLKQDAVPSIFPNIPPRLQPKTAKPRRELKRRNEEIQVQIKRSRHEVYFAAPKAMGSGPNPAGGATTEVDHVNGEGGVCVIAKEGPCVSMEIAPCFTTEVVPSVIGRVVPCVNTEVETRFSSEVELNLPVTNNEGYKTWWNHWIPTNDTEKWMLETKSSPQHVSLLQILYIDNVPKVHRSVVVCRYNGSWRAFLDSDDITSKLIESSSSLPPASIKTAEDAKAILLHLSRLSRCVGLGGLADVRSSRIAVKKNDHWFSINCSEVCQNAICPPCVKLHPTLQNRFYRQVAKRKRQDGKERSTVKARELAYYKNRTIAYKCRQRQLKQQLRKLKQSKANSDISKIRILLEDTNLPENTRKSILHSFQAARRKSPKGVRYSSDWLLECLLLKIKSPAAYHHLREAKLLPLPHPNTLRRLISGQKCDFGFNDVSFQAIKEEFRNSERRDRQGVLVFDEVQLRESIEFSKRDMKFVGYIDFSEDNRDLIPEGDQGKLANHALVLMYRPFNNSWVQPIGVFATRNAAKGTVLQKLIMSAILKLEDIGAEVLCVVCDGSKPNKSFWKLMGVTGYPSHIVNKIPHPADNSRYLYFASDVPHLFKCIRNNFRKHTVIRFQGKEASFKFYEKLLSADKRRQCGLRKCPKLSNSHIWPNNFEKMIVSYATQVFSRSVATGIRFYRTLGYSDFYGSEATEELTQQLNDTFDALNGRYRRDGITPGSQKYEELMKFQRVLSDEIVRCDDKEDLKTFASKETLAALRVTVASTMDIVNYLVNDLKFTYVLTAKMNQDCLEKFFGLIRAAGGREDHPTISNFIQLYRLLTIYSPAKRALRGNICDDEDVGVLCKFDNFLRSSRKSREIEVQERKDRHLTSIMEQLKHVDENIAGAVDEIPLDEADKSIVYYLAGFLCYKARKLTNCNECINSICSNAEAEQCNDVLMTNIMNFGPLHYPSAAFVNVIMYGVEKRIVGLIQRAYMYGDIILECIKNITAIDVSGIGCSIDGHGCELLSVLIPYYISMRLHFYARAVKNDLGRGKSTKNKRKESKLLS